MEVLVMGKPAFENYLASIQARISAHNDCVELFEKKVKKLGQMIKDGINVQDSRIKLDAADAELPNLRIKIRDLKKFYVDIKQQWSKPKDRVIGFVRWAPPIGGGVLPRRYTRDVCVIELYKDKFKHMIGNVISLGALIFYFN